MLIIREIPKSKAFEVPYQHGEQEYTVTFTMARPAGNDFLKLFKPGYLNRVKDGVATPEANAEFSESAVDYALTKIESIEGVRTDKGEQLKPADASYLPWVILQGLAAQYGAWAIEVMTGAQPDKKKPKASSDSSGS